MRFRFVVFTGLPPCLCALSALAAGEVSSAARAQKERIMTVPERTGYARTSTSAEVTEFIRAIALDEPSVRLTTSGLSAKGVPIPLVIVASPMVYTPQEAVPSGKLVVYVQANIHGGEVEGKEAAQMLLRDLVTTRKSWLRDAIFLIQPVYNIDGNDSLGPGSRNRPGQNGPNLVGLRANGQGLDLNRDCVKAESPEFRGALEHVYSWNPHVVFDLHTTDGTRHGYPLTYGGPGHPNTPAALQNYAFQEFFPAIRRTMRSKHQRETFDYGNVVFPQGRPRFETFGGEARYVTHYGGLRPAMTILSEAMVYETFKDRIWDTYHFVGECLSKLIRDRRRVRGIIDSARRDLVAGKLIGKPMATRFKLKERGIEPVLVEKNLRTAGNRSGPVRDVERISMPIADRFEAAASQPMPAAYAFTNDTKSSAVITLLQRHGISVERFLALVPLVGEQLKIENPQIASSPFQGHRLVTPDGRFQPNEPMFEGYLVRTAQPLGLLVFDLLEPLCADGVVAWGAYGETWNPGDLHPMIRLRSLDGLLTETLRPLAIRG